MASLIGNFLPPPDTVSVRRTAAGSIAWSNEIYIKASRRVIPPLGYIVSALGGGVVKVQTTSFARTWPFADLVPAGTRAVNFVAIGNRLSVSNMSVFVPSQRHRPSTCGDSSTGANFEASSCDVKATIGCENVTLRSGASGISPSGEKRTTSNAWPLTSTFGVPRWSSDGNLTGILLPVFGAGRVPMRLAKSVLSSVSGLISGIRLSKEFASASESGSVTANGCFSRFSAPSTPSLRRNFNPSGVSFILCCIALPITWPFATKLTGAI